MQATIPPTRQIPNAAPKAHLEMKPTTGRYHGKNYKTSTNNDARYKEGWNNYHTTAILVEHYYDGCPHGRLAQLGQHPGQYNHPRGYLPHNSVINTGIKYIDTEIDDYRDMYDNCKQSHQQPYRTGRSHPQQDDELDNFFWCTYHPWYSKCIAPPSAERLYTATHNNKSKDNDSSNYRRQHQTINKRQHQNDKRWYRKDGKSNNAGNDTKDTKKWHPWL